MHEQSNLLNQFIGKGEHLPSNDSVGYNQVTPDTRTPNALPVASLQTPQRMVNGKQSPTALWLNNFWGKQEGASKVESSSTMTHVPAVTNVSAVSSVPAVSHVSIETPAPQKVASESPIPEVVEVIPEVIPKVIPEVILEIPVVEQVPETQAAPPFIEPENIKSGSEDIKQAVPIIEIVPDEVVIVEIAPVQISSVILPQEHGQIAVVEPQVESIPVETQHIPEHINLVPENIPHEVPAVPVSIPDSNSVPHEENILQSNKHQSHEKGASSAEQKYSKSNIIYKSVFDIEDLTLIEAQKSLQKFQAHPHHGHHNLEHIAKLGLGAIIKNSLSGHDHEHRETIREYEERINAYTEPKTIKTAHVLLALQKLQAMTSGYLLPGEERMLRPISAGLPSYALMVCWTGFWTTYSAYLVFNLGFKKAIFSRYGLILLGSLFSYRFVDQHVFARIREAQLSYHRSRLAAKTLKEVGENFIRKVLRPDFDARKEKLPRQIVI